MDDLRQKAGWGLVWLFVIFANTCSMNKKLESIRTNLEKIEHKLELPIKPTENKPDMDIDTGARKFKDFEI